MSNKPPSYAELTHRVMRDAPEPLTVDQIIARVHAIRPITTKNPKQTIRSAISTSALIVSTGDGRYGWKMHVIDGALLRHTLQEAEFVERMLFWDQDLRDALWPTFLAIRKYNDRSPTLVSLPNGEVIQCALEHIAYDTWGSRADEAFWAWFDTLGAQVGDHLLFRVVDSEQRRYAVTFEARSARDEHAVQQRNVALLEIARKQATRPYGIMLWELATHLLATGFYHHPVPPDPLSEVWDQGKGEDGSTLSEEQSERLPVSVLLGQPPTEHEDDYSPVLPPEYDPDLGRRRVRRSRRARRGSVRSFLLRVNHRSLPEVWRDLELAEDNTLEDLHLLIQNSFQWWDDHLYSFFLSGKAWDKQSEIGSPWSEARLHTHQVQMGQLELQEGQVFLYLFDYGDQHEFDVTVLQINPVAPKGEYPRVVSYQGVTPPQYPDEDDDRWRNWDPHRHWRE